MKKLTAIVSKGKNKGTTVTPHRYQAGYFLVSKGGNTRDCAQKVSHENELEAWIQRGYSIRMSGPGVPASLYAPAHVIFDHEPS